MQELKPKPKVHVVVHFAPLFCCVSTFCVWLFCPIAKPFYPAQFIFMTFSYYKFIFVVNTSTTIFVSWIRRRNKVVYSMRCRANALTVPFCPAFPYTRPNVEKERQRLKPLGETACSINRQPPSTHTHTHTHTKHCAEGVSNRSCAHLLARLQLGNDGKIRM